LGKPYALELSRLARTYDWACDSDIEPLADLLGEFSSVPLLAVGSGGSLTAARFAAYLHELYAGQVAKAVTPLEVVQVPHTPVAAAVLMLSAGGSNPDILGAFERVVGAEYRAFGVMCSRTRSQLSQRCTLYEYARLVEFDLPTGKDGFLATNSLLAFCVLLARGYMSVFGDSDGIPGRLGELNPTSAHPNLSSALREACARLWERDTLVVIHGAATSSAAFDIESKFTEAALGNVQISDYRNFAHGRHHWLARRPRQSAVLALVTEDEEAIARRMLRLIPDEIPAVRLDFPGRGPQAALGAIVAALYLAGLAGEARGIDPGRPGVPPFGSRLYNLNVFRTTKAAGGLTHRAAAAIQRKAAARIETLERNGLLEYWKTVYAGFMQELERARFAAVVFDYDGTLCDAAHRECGLDSDVADNLNRLLRAGIVVGVATGRGKSVKTALECALDKKYWQRTLVGYYNGAYISRLGEAIDPAATSAPIAALALIADELASNARLRQVAGVEARHLQLTVTPKPHVSRSVVWDMVNAAMSRNETAGVNVVGSGHSIDVLAPDVSKRTLVSSVRAATRGGARSAVLCAGDRGRWPGNDHALLAEPLSLSVDEVSPDPTRCWNLARPGYRGVQAMKDYFLALRCERSKLRVAFDAGEE